MTFDYAQFIEDGYTQQSKYDKAAGFKFTANDLRQIDQLVSIGGEEVFEKFKDAIDFRYQLINTYMLHMIEEIIEARVMVPRRSWKNNEPSYLNNPEQRKAFIAEMFDQLLFHRAILAYAGISGKEFAQVAAEKTNYNAKRKDHNVNGTESAPQNPSAELQGDCASSAFATPEEEEIFEMISNRQKI